MFEATDVVRMLDKASPQLKTMILLAVNCGFGNNDCATLPTRSLDLDGGWLDYARPKTGIHRRCPLWPETVESLREALAKRRTPKDDAHAGLVFVTAALGSYAKDTNDNPIAKEFRQARRASGSCIVRDVASTRLRHTFRTVADGCSRPTSGRFHHGPR